MKTALAPEPPFDNMTDFKDWLILRFVKLSIAIDNCDLTRNPLRQSYHLRRLELIEIGRAVGMDLVVNKSLEE